jgi:hypothetical protein
VRKACRQFVQPWIVRHHHDARGARGLGPLEQLLGRGIVERLHQLQLRVGEMLRNQLPCLPAAPCLGDQRELRIAAGVGQRLADKRCIDATLGGEGAGEIVLAGGRLRRLGVSKQNELAHPPPLPRAPSKGNTLLLPCRERDRMSTRGKREK